MALVDYQESLIRLQRGMAHAYTRTPHVLNVPGKSAACKVDPHYYLALEPAFTEAMARWSASFPESVLETLVRTGNLVLRRKEGRRRMPPGGAPVAHAMRVAVVWGGREFVVRAAFLPADFVDRALMLYAWEARPLAVSALRIRADQRSAVDAFFTGLTPLDSLAYAY